MLTKYGEESVQNVPYLEMIQFSSVSNSSWWCYRIQWSQSENGDQGWNKRIDRHSICRCSCCNLLIINTQELPLSINSSWTIFFRWKNYNNKKTTKTTKNTAEQRQRNRTWSRRGVHLQCSYRPKGSYFNCLITCFHLKHRYTLPHIWSVAL